MDYLIRVIDFFDRHSGLISAVGLVLAAIGLLLTYGQLRLYRDEIRNERVEKERLAWERMLKLLHEVARYAAEAQISSATHSPLALPNFDDYQAATETLFSYWHQLQVEMNIMPASDLTDTLRAFVSKYQSADSRASEQFIKDLTPIVFKVANLAQK
jgi:uncharacterized protein YigA (DUF484 family)